MSNCDRFINAYAKIEQFLRRTLKEEVSTGFANLVERAAKSNPAVRRYQVDLKEYGDLRNAIVHERTDSRPIADPRDDATFALERIARVLTDPPKVFPLFRADDVIEFAPEDPIGKAVRRMYECNVSQVPICTAQAFDALLTTDTVARWLGASISDDIFSLSETKIKDVLKFTEYEPNYDFLPKHATVFNVLERFHESDARGSHLNALLITETGDKRESIIGIVTVADLPKAYSEINAGAVTPNW